MEGSWQHACPAECVGSDRLSGSSERVHDQRADGSGPDPADKEISKSAAFFKSPTYTPNADDSGFVEMCPPPETDDYALPLRRSNFLQSANVCSTPNRGSIPSIADSSPIHVTPFHVSPLAFRPYFITQSDQQNIDLIQPKVIFNTVFDKSTFGQTTQASLKDDLFETGFAEKTELDIAKNTGIITKQRSDLTRGHSTIASLLNSVPLNLAKTEHKISESKTKQETVTTSNVVDVKGEKVKSEGKYGEENKTLKDFIQNEPLNSAYSENKHSKEVFDSQYVYESNILNNEHSLTEILGSHHASNVDENNNDLLHVPKYSDISDACASDSENSTDTSSSDDEDPKSKEIVKLPANKVRTRRKSLNPCRSAAREDPRFKGVTVWLQTLFQNGDSRLQISACYSNVKVVSPTRRSQAYQKRCLTPQYYSDQDVQSPPYALKDSHVTVKTCASCKTRRTPLWRDAEDGTPLCNACGIRYKKYRLRCSRCWHIPKKEVKTYPNCPLCGASLRFSFHKKSW